MTWNNPETDDAGETYDGTETYDGSVSGPSSVSGPPKITRGPPRSIRRARKMVRMSQPPSQKLRKLYTILEGTS